jgi:hypothetical protein
MIVMIGHLRRRVFEALAAGERGLLVTCGAAGPQASHVPYDTDGAAVYVLLPLASDHLFNVEGQPDALLLTDRWELRGRALVMLARQPASVKRVQRDWEVWLEIQPTRFQFLSEDGMSPVETIDFA